MALLETVSLDNKQFSTTEHPSPGGTQPSASTRAQRGVRFAQADLRMITLATFVVGLVVAASGTIWAIELGVVYPIAIMAGYSTFVATVCLALIWSKGPIFEAEQDPQAKASARVSGAWKHVSKLRVSDAARLWCDVEPGAMLTQEVIAWGCVLVDAIENGELPCIRSEAQHKGSASYSYDKPHWSTEVTRDALKAWARTRGFSPSFLQD